MGSNSLFLDHAVTREDRADGSMVLRSGLELGPVARTTIDWLDHWAGEAPDRVFIAERSEDGWREVTYASMRDAVRNVAASLLGRGIGEGKTIAVLSGPSVDHGILMLATQMIGAVIVPLAEQYSLVGEAHGKLEYCIEKTSPSLVFAEDAGRFASALALDALRAVPAIASRTGGATRAVVAFSDLMEGREAVDEATLDAARAATGPDTLAKILFTSGSTSNPKGVPQTQRMMCVNQAQYLACLPILRERPHVMLDWLPWNHVFAGNSDFNMILSNGGSLYLDDGKPVGKLFERTLANFALCPTPTLSFNVPVAHGLAVQAMARDPELRRKYFAELDIFFYAGASLPAEIWNAVEEMAIAERGDVPLMTSSWGMTETAPAALLYYEKGARSGMIGVPMPELEAKLIPVAENRYELRVRGPNVITEYFDDPQKSAESFDDEGFFITGDAVRLVDPGDVTRGVFFDGRLTEDFKLMTGTWVQATNLRISALGALQGLVQDVVIVGEGHEEIGLLVFPLAGRVGEAGINGGAVVDPAYAAEIGKALDRLAGTATGSSSRICRAIILAEPPSVGAGEITAKGSLNVRTITTRRKGVLDRLYDDADPAVIRIGSA